jgi:hypothetical protein
MPIVIRRELPKRRSKQKKAGVVEHLNEDFDHTGLLCDGPPV